MLKKLLSIGRMPVPQKYRTIGDKYRNDRQFLQAADSYVRHLRDHPDDFDIWVQAGNCLKEAKLYERAKESYQSAMKLRPRDADLYLQLGHLAKMMNDNILAAEHFRSALDIDGSNIHAAAELSNLNPVEIAHNVGLNDPRNERRIETGCLHLVGSPAFPGEDLNGLLADLKRTLTSRAA